jgi:hypothetical protein
MRSFLVAGALAALAAGPSPAQFEEKFADCATMTGQAYQRARDRFLAAPADPALLRKKLDSKAWQERLTAHILLGWQQHEKEYRKLLAAPRIIDQKGVAHYAWAVGREGVPASAVPLLYELMMKDVGPEAAADAAGALIVLAQNKPGTPLDVVLLNRCLGDESFAIPSCRRAVAWALSKLPADYQEQDETLAALRAELARKDRDRGIAEALLQALARAAGPLRTDQKDALVQEVFALKGLEDLLGKTSLVYAVGGIGGDEASKRVAAYLEQTPDDLEKRWALNTLSRSDSPVATEVLLRYASPDTTQLALRDEAIEGLGRTRYTPQVGARLEALVLGDQAPEEQKLQALYSLERIRASNPTDKKLQKQIESRLQTISASKPKGSRLQSELERILKGLREP